MEFAFTALDPRGTKIQERLRADNSQVALKELQGRGLIVLSLAEEKVTVSDTRHTAVSPFSGRKRRVKTEQIVALTRELAIMVETGVSITMAVDTLLTHADNLTIRDALFEARADLAEGKSISQSLGKHPKVFPKLFIDLIRTAEAGGSLDETLNRAADYIESSHEMKRKVTGAMIYPGVLLTATLLVLTFLLTFVVPQFQEMFVKMNADIPVSTQILFALSDFLRLRWWLLFLGIAALFFGSRQALKQPANQQRWTHVVHRLPIFGNLVKKVAMSRMLRSLATLNSSGVSLLVSLQTASQTAQNVLYEKALLQVRSQVEQGASLTEAITASGIFPGMVCQMVAVGENSGRLSSILMRIASYYEREVEAKLKVMTSIIEPVMIVVLGFVVGFIAVSIIVPIYSLVGSVK